MIFVKNAKDLRFVRFNKSGEELLGYSREELIGKNDYDFFPKEEADFFTEKDRDVLSSGKHLDIPEELIQTKNKGERILHTKKIPIINEEGMPQYLLGISEDITERKWAEKALLESEERFKSLYNSMAEGVCLHELVYNDSGNAIDYRILDANPSYENILGLGKKHVKNKLASVVYETVPPPYLETYAEVTRTGKPIQFEGFFPPMAKHFLISSFSPGRDQFATIFQDITERKKAEQALRQSEQKFHLLFDNAPVGYQSLDENGCFLDVNQAWMDILGYERHEVIGKWFGDFLPLELVEVFKERFKKNIQRDDLIPNVEFPLLKKDGSIAMVDYMARIGRDEEGHFIRTHCAFMDITESRKLEEQLRQSQKMEAVGTLAGGIAHDFNNILAVILGNTELAAFDIPDSNPAAMSLKAIHQASLRAKDMVQQLLAFSRKSDEKSRPFNMTPIIKESMKLLRSAVPTSVEFKQHLSGDLCNVLGDATQIHQIVMNLVTNAAHAMSEEGGLLEVTLENITLQEEKPCFDWVLSPGKYVMLKMRDTGEGIEPAIINRIFEPYYTSKEVGKGTGMGLSVVHGIMKRHNGGIRVESELGKGTVFEIYFPALEEMSDEENEPEGEIKGGSESILFVDDEESLVNLNRQRLERLGYQVKCTTKPEEALEWFKADPDQFDVIITDMTMPRMTGDRLAAEVLKIRPHMPVVICTGYSQRMSEKKAAALGASKYIEKPIDLRNLASALREVLDEK